MIVASLVCSRRATLDAACCLVVEEPKTEKLAKRIRNVSLQRVGQGQEREGDIPGGTRFINVLCSKNRDSRNSGEIMCSIRLPFRRSQDPTSPGIAWSYFKVIRSLHVNMVETLLGFDIFQSGGQGFAFSAEFQNFSRFSQHRSVGKHQLGPRDDL